VADWPLVGRQVYETWNRAATSLHTALEPFRSQLPPNVALGPAILFLVASDAGTVTVVLFVIWSVIVSFSDGILKPLLLGRGTEMPVGVILIGAIGGLILHGLIGQFV
jgi:hypothetical protein